MQITTKVSGANSQTAATLPERAISACRAAKALEEIGQYEEARLELTEFWKRIGERPQVEGLDELAKAEVLLRTGALSGLIGSAQQITGAQEIAKDLISEAARIFQTHEQQERLAEAQLDLATCYWREGAFDEARVTLDLALKELGDVDSEQRLRAFLNRAIIEKVSNRYDDALKTHREAAPYFERSTNHVLKGKFHNEYATVLKNVGLAKNSSDLIDHALVEFAAASFHAEQAGNDRLLAPIENNVGYLFVRLGRFAEAHKHLERASSLFTALRDKGMVAQVNDTRARAFIAQGSFSRGEAMARSAVKALQEGDEFSLLAEALTTHATALARLGNHSRARATLEKAIRTAHTAGALETSGVAALTMVEELRDHLPSEDLLAYYRIAESELDNSQHTEIQSRLGKCARWLLGSHSPVDGERIHHSQPAAAEGTATPTLTEATLEEQVKLYEANLIQQALEVSGGSVTRAARMLGITHQGLAFILNGRHKHLLASRSPVKRRRRSIIKIR